MAERQHPNPERQTDARMFANSQKRTLVCYVVILARHRQLPIPHKIPHSTISPYSH